MFILPTPSWTCACVATDGLVPPTTAVHRRVCARVALCCTRAKPSTRPCCCPHLCAATAWAVHATHWAAAPAQVPRDREADLVPFLRHMEASSKELGITDVQLSLASLVGARRVWRPGQGGTSRMCGWAPGVFLMP